MQIILVKLTLYVTEKCQKAKYSPFICWQNPLNVKRKPHQKSNNFHAVPAASTAGPCPTIIGLVLWFYNNMQKGMATV